MLTKILSIKTASIVIIISLSSCSEDWLEAKRDLALIVPETLNDMTLLLRDENNLAKDNNNLLELSGDDYYIPSDVFGGRTEIEQNAYLWNKDIFRGQQNIADWDQAYAQIAVANVVLEGLDGITRDAVNQNHWDNVKGSALHLRGRAMYYLAQNFSAQYDPNTASSDAGIPVRLSPDTNVPVVRFSNQETYDQILDDLTQASELLPDQPNFVMDASRASAYGYLARCYLVMGRYDDAFGYADKFLQQHNELMDFNTLDPASTFPMPRYNAEVIQHTESSTVYGVFVFSYSRVPDDIYNLYEDDDLRKSVFFRDMTTGEQGTHGYRGSYTGSVQLFSGISTNEMYLIRAECLARIGNTDDALRDLDDLLITRWVTGTYVPRTAATPAEALDLILTERRKELLRRGQRWIDLRRLNKDSGRASVSKRILDGTEYVLNPNDVRYVLPIPDYVIAASGIEQNPR